MARTFSRVLGRGNHSEGEESSPPFRHVGFPRKALLKGFPGGQLAAGSVLLGLGAPEAEASERGAH